MDAISISLRGMETSAAQFTRAAADTVRDTLPASTGSVSPATLSTGDVNSDLVGQMMAVANYRANARAWQAANRMMDITVNLIG
jgi:hypothetical protein